MNVEKEIMCCVRMRSVSLSVLIEEHAFFVTCYGQRKRHNFRVYRLATSDVAIALNKMKNAKKSCEKWTTAWYAPKPASVMRRSDNSLFHLKITNPSMKQNDEAWMSSI
jgi:hypothetical protein